MAVYDAPRFLFTIGFLVFTLFFMVNSDETCDIEIENTLKSLLAPEHIPTMQQQSLRNYLIRRLQEVLEKANEGEANKRSLSSLAQWDNLPGKRNIEALARAGYFRTLPEQEEDDPNYKRSLANLAKNDQLPSFQNNESKRGIESLARNGELHSTKELQDLLDELYSKRNVGSLARNFNFPSYGKRYLGSLMRNGDFQYNGKRNIASLAREGGFVGKRNAAALLRQDSYLNSHQNEEDKRHIASIKAQFPTRSKRQTNFYEEDNGEIPAPVYQNQNVDDYEQIMKALTETYPTNDKRFLGRLPQMGKPKTTPSPRIRFH